MIEIKKKSDCCGCTACANACPKSCIEMIEDSEGFLYPVVHEDKCIKCNACEKVCPIINHVARKENRSQTAAIVQNKNKEVCLQSTAGGAFTAIAEYVLEHDGIVFGVELQADYSVKHIAVESKTELSKFRNSKYVQSELGSTYAEVKQQLKSGRLVCFSGTPCQIEGLRCFLRRDYENLVLVDVVCRAVPSPGVWKKYIEMETCEHGTMQSIRFRDKALGYQYSTMELVDSQGNIYRGGIESQPWLRMFFSGMIIRPSCTECKFRSRYRNSDFTIWDCFNVYSFSKEFDEDIGTTRVLIHTENGKRIFHQIEGKIKYKSIDADMAVEGVREMLESPKMHPQRQYFYSDLKKLPFDDLINKYYPLTTKIKIKRNIRLALNKFGLDKKLKHILKKGK